MKRIILIAILVLASIFLLLPYAGMWLEVKRAEMFSREVERKNDPIKPDFIASPTPEIYLSKEDIYFNQGSTYAQTGQPYAAIFCYNRAIELNHDDDDSYISRGKTYMELNQSDKAISDFNHAIQINPDNPLAYRLRGFVYLEKGNIAQAIADCDESIEKSHGGIYREEYDRKATEAVEKGDFAASFRYIKKAYDSPDKEKGDAYWVRGTAYEYKGDLTQALSDYNKAIEIASFFHPEAYYLSRAKLYFQMGEYDKSWMDVHKVQSLKCKVDADFLRKLKKASGG